VTVETETTHLHAFDPKARDQLRAFGAELVDSVPRIGSYQDVLFVYRSKGFDKTMDDPALAGYEHSALLYEGTMPALNGPEQLERRRIESTLFRRRQLKRYEEEIVGPGVRQLLGDLAETSRGADGIVRTDLVPALKRRMFRLMATITGFDNVDTEERLARIEELFVDIDAGFRLRHIKDYEPVVERALVARAAVRREFFEPSLRRRKQLVADVEAGRRDRSELPTDIITIILTHPEHYAPWGEEVIFRETAMYISGSVGTSVNHTCHTIEELCLWIAKHPEDEALLTDVDFLTRAFHEELRKYSILPVDLRRANRDIVLPNGVHVPEGGYVSLDVPAATRDLLGPDGLEFNPRRELPAHVRRYLFAFGEGAHTCTGKPLVMGEEEEERADPRKGVVVAMLRELFRAGVRVDPSRPVEVTATIVRTMHSSLPVTLTKL
jgi:cytochrome P450